MSNEKKEQVLTEIEKALGIKDLHDKLRAREKNISFLRHLQEAEDQKKKSRESAEKFLSNLFQNNT